MNRSLLVLSLSAAVLAACSVAEPPVRSPLGPPPPVMLAGHARPAAAVPAPAEGEAVPAFATEGATVDMAGLEAEARALVPPFAAQMLATVKEAMAAGGPVSAIGACQVLAPLIAREHSRSPWTVGRTALRVRNPTNAPDAWERAVLERFAAEAARGRQVAELRHGEVVGGEYRYLQAIATGEPCLACHGTAVAAPVLQALREKYPQDAATGFAAGELRGAFTLRRRLE